MSEKREKLWGFDIAEQMKWESSDVIIYLPVVGNSLIGNLEMHLKKSIQLNMDF